jgi:alkylation response protein AidB-like acyl-CoA dehydrogenase
MRGGIERAEGPDLSPDAARPARRRHQADPADRRRIGIQRGVPLALARENGAAGRPAMRARIARAWSGLRAMRYMAMRSLSEDPDADARRDALGYKYHWSNWHRDLGRLGMDVLGLGGAAGGEDPRADKLRQLFFFTRADTVYGGTNEIQLNIVAERGLGMPREPRGDAR